MPDFVSWVLGIQPRSVSNNRQHSVEHGVSRVGCPCRVLPLSPESDKAAIDYQSLEWLTCQGRSDEVARMESQRRSQVLACGLSSYDGNF